MLFMNTLKNAALCWQEVPPDAPIPKPMLGIKGVYVRINYTGVDYIFSFTSEAHSEYAIRVASDANLKPVR